VTSILSIIANLFSLLRWLADFVSAEKNKQAGRDEVSAQVNKEAADAEKRMAEVPDNPSDDDVAGRMSNGSFLVSQSDVPNDTQLRSGDTKQGAVRIPTFARWFKD
jgi:hypothetical protein